MQNRHEHIQKTDRKTCAAVVRIGKNFKKEFSRFPLKCYSIGMQHNKVPIFFYRHIVKCIKINDF